MYHQGKKTKLYRRLWWKIGLFVVTVVAVLSLWQYHLPHEFTSSASEGRVVCESLFPLVRQDFVVDAEGNHLKVTKLPKLQDGDVLTTNATHFLGWRHGHAALVVDAERGITLEAFSIGTVSELSSVSQWQYCPNVQVLRLKADEATKHKIVEYAVKHLQGIPYRLSAGAIDDKDMNGKYWGTQCAHLVWLAFYQFGFDVDGDGGWLVTPADLQQSELLEQVETTD